MNWEIKKQLRSRAETDTRGQCRDKREGGRVHTDSIYGYTNRSSINKKQERAREKGRELGGEWGLADFNCKVTLFKATLVHIRQTCSGIVSGPLATGHPPQGPLASLGRCCTDGPLDHNRCDLPG